LVQRRLASQDAVVVSAIEILKILSSFSAEKYGKINMRGNALLNTK
jgi:hypothetical protein